jgi:HPt (histidine-containing phosphotransfer) domain-containing protein
MAQAVSKTIEPAPIAAATTVIDRSLLDHMTFGDRNLEREVLRLFDRQAELLIARMGVSEPPAVAALAHTLKGSALGIGAASVARAAAATELAASAGVTECRLAVGRLAVAVDEARATIAALLHAY